MTDKKTKFSPSKPAPANCQANGESESSSVPEYDLSIMRDYYWSQKPFFEGVADLTNMLTSKQYPILFVCRDAAHVRCISELLRCCDVPISVANVKQIRFLRGHYARRYRCVVLDLEGLEVTSDQQEALDHVLRCSRDVFGIDFIELRTDSDYRRKEVKDQ